MSETKKSTPHTHPPDGAETQHLDKAEEDQIHLGAEIEHEQGEKRENIAEKAQKLEGD